MSKRIIFLTTAHIALDDRIFYHQARALSEAGHTVKITSLSSNLVRVIDNITIESYNIISTDSKRNKIKKLYDILVDFKPEIIICSEPLPVFAAYQYKRNNKELKIVYDITEWYPSKKQLAPLAPHKRVVSFFALWIINIIAGYKSNAFVFGEESKKKPFSLLFKNKKSIISTYYPSSKYISYKPSNLSPNKITLCYTGKISEEKGINNFLKACKSFSNINKEIETRIKIIGATGNNEDARNLNHLLQEYSNLNIEVNKPISFLKFSEAIADTDICFDLRSIDRENNKCLPIKIFYYAAMGKPVVYSNLDAIEEAVKIKDFGALVDPTDDKAIANIILKYCNNADDLYNKHSQNARMLFVSHYNWELIQEDFTTFIDSL